MNKIVFFEGSKRDFNSYIENHEIEEYTPFMELIRQYNEKIRANDTFAVNEIGEDNRDFIENVVIYSDDFASVTDHVITNFPNIVILGHDIENLYIQNPPKHVKYSLEVEFDNIIKYRQSNYYEAGTEDIIQFYKELKNSNVIGQEEAKKKTCVGLYKAAVLKKNQPLVLLYYGPSGVGKTELAKKISSFYDGKLTRIQFSMMQTEEAIKYIFGDSHGKPSLARDLLSRETNIVLIDEFDKVSPSLYNVFYQMFDEGEFEDINYKVDVSNCVFILTSNFNNEKHIAEVLGFPIFSRIDTKIKFKQLTNEELTLVIEEVFDNIYQKISIKDKKLIDEAELKVNYLKSVEIFKNIRMLDKFIENDIFNVLFESKIQDN
ncbi:ATP-dependent Clp protease ATP-binding subunit [Enterococcus faecium]|uniref:AAA family ATPase n=1 Tax=Enterococcus faecium TaxID=1352 RepID=UPI0010C04D18|nr:AAA family ATPase [Enterococcus faecium]TKN83531.1 ATP-dependent Clp protease ATP-binding subunit [Enterococcus faecium]TKN83783.1 ATP-dependent Clp protease ATP-binding subunit [Enterococcus faecium]TKO43086.1 ATP-dependent Clp protease ATP-binding subunit [Enterococcus faecium]